ncbi:MAG TPA: efflux transporter outer membrane subunit [Micropepsaceae bacterium]|nr:efflux transporter outer membrane subunit [Micropepsaceae bacterium]
MLRHVRSLFVAGSAAAILTGCALGPDFVRPAAPAVPQYTPDALPAQTASADTIAGDAQRFLTDADVPGQWWMLFGSPALNQLEQEALRANPDVETAQATLRQAHEEYLAQAGALFPQVGVSAGVTHEATSAGGRASSPPFDLFTAGPSVSYTPDVFGGIARSIEAQAAAEQNSRFQLEATYLTLTSNVIVTVIQAASLSAQIAATQDIIADEQQLLDLLNQQFELGAVARGDVLTQQSQLAQVQATLGPLQKQLEQARFTLSTLVGRFPSQNQIPDIQLADLQLPRDLPLSVPSKLVEQRPDIRASEALMHEASAQIGVADANMFPQFTVSGNVTNEANVLNQFFQGNPVWSIGASVTAPIFRGGTLRAQERAAHDLFDRTAAQYKTTVLNAFSNVAGTLSALTLDAETLKTQLYAEQTAQQSLEIIQQQFQAGAIAYLSLLDAQRTYEQARIGLVIAQSNRFADTVALFQSLGGGWWNREDAPDIRNPAGIASNQ